MSDTRTKPLVTTELVEPGKHNFYADNGLLIGYAYQEIDGYFVFLPNDKLQGYQSEYNLYAIADALRMLNRDWDKVVGSDPAIGGQPGYQPPATLAEMQGYFQKLVPVLRRAIDQNEIAEGVRKMEGLTRPSFYPWMKPVHTFMIELIAGLKGAA